MQNPQIRNCLLYIPSVSRIFNKSYPIHTLKFRFFCVSFYFSMLSVSQGVQQIDKMKDDL